MVPFTLNLLYGDIDIDSGTQPTVALGGHFLFTMSMLNFHDRSKSASSEIFVYARRFGAA